MQTALANCRLVFLLSLALATLFATAGLAAENYVIIAVDPASDELSVGDRFVPDDKISVPANVTVKLIGEDGSIKDLEGPATYIVTEEELPIGETDASREEYQGKLAVIANLLTSDSRKVESIGGTRGTGKAQSSHSADPWAIPVDTAGPGCLRDGRVLIWRQSASETESFAIRVDDVQHPGLVWSGSADTFDVSRFVSVTATSLTVERGQNASRISLVRMAPNAVSTNPIDVAAWMASSGCTQQAFAFVRQLASR